MQGMEPGMLRHTALREVHESLGATFTDFAGWSMPVRYGSETAEHHAVRNTAGLFDLSHMGEIDVVGPEAGAALDYALVGRPSSIGVGRARYSMLCAEDGGILDDLVVYRIEEQRYLVVANASNTAVAADALSVRVAGFDATVRDVSQDWALLAVQGPTSEAIVSRLTDVDVPSLKYYAINAATVAGVEALVARTGYTGEDGFELYCRPSAAVALWLAATEAGDEHGLVPAGLACRDTLRLEAGMPLYGQELSTEVTPYEAGLGRVVVLDKPDPFVGQKALAARHAQGPRSVLVGLLPDGRRSPRAGYEVLDPTSGSVVGRVTSGSPSPTLGRPVAMAHVAPHLSALGTPLQILLRGSVVGASVAPLPFYTRTR